MTRYAITHVNKDNMRVLTYANQGRNHFEKRPFSTQEWATITAEAKRICAKAQRALYAGSEDFASSTKTEHTEFGFRVGFNEPYAWRTFPHPDKPTAMQGGAIKLAGPCGQRETLPEITDELIALNGEAPEDYESFVLERDAAKNAADYKLKDPAGIFNFCKTEYRAYDPVVVSILCVARTVAPDAITVTSDGGPEAIKLMF